MIIKNSFVRSIILILAVLIFGILIWSFLPNTSLEKRCDNKAGCPNIVFVILDDMAWSQFGFLSNTASVTPHLDNMAKEGFVFRNVYNTNSRCRASLATYLTGQLPQQNLIYSNQGVLKLYDEQALLPLLSKAGYATFIGGKMWEGNPKQLRATEHDLDTFHFVRKSQDKLTAFLDHHANKQPVFIWWAPMLPHKSHNPPEQYFKTIDQAAINIPDSIREEDKKTYQQAEHAFLATIAWVDDEFGQLRQSLIDHGLAENTWIIVLSDNGWSNRYPAKGAPYDIGVRTPLIVIGPDVIHGDTDKLFSTQNLYGSILALAGLEASDDRKAVVDLFKITQQQNTIVPSSVENVVYWASYPSYTSKSEPKPRAGRDVYALSLREENWQYTFYVKSFDDTNSNDEKAPSNIHSGLDQDYSYDSGDEDLFDLSADPFSQNNIAENDEKYALVLTFRKKVFEWWKQTGGKEIDSIENCKLHSSSMCGKYYQVYPELLL